MLHACSIGWLGQRVRYLFSYTGCVMIVKRTVSFIFCKLCIHLHENERKCERSKAKEVYWPTDNQQATESSGIFGGRSLVFFLPKMTDNPVNVVAIGKEKKIIIKSHIPTHIGEVFLQNVFSTCRKIRDCKLKRDKTN